MRIENIMAISRITRTTTTTIYSVVAFLVCFMVASYVFAYAPMAIELVRIAFTGDFLGYAVTGLDEDHGLVGAALEVHGWFTSDSITSADIGTYITRNDVSFTDFGLWSE